VVRVRGGTLDDTSWLRPTKHIWTRRKQPWVKLPEGPVYWQPDNAVQRDRDAAQRRLARLIAKEIVPTSMRLKAQIASRLNQLRARNLRPR
jgi:hypothetical protein